MIGHSIFAKAEPSISIQQNKASKFNNSGKLSISRMKAFYDDITIFSVCSSAKYQVASQPHYWL
jgi:hypothetical protein